MRCNPAGNFGRPHRAINHGILKSSIIVSKNLEKNFLGNDFRYEYI